MMDQERAGPQRIDPVASGCRAPPPPRTSAPPSPTTDGSSNDISTDRTFKEGASCLIAIVSVIGAIAGLSYYCVRSDHNDNYPRFKVESILVSFEHNNVSSDDSQVTAKWNIGFSVRNSNWQTSFHFREFHVWVGCMSQASSVAILPPLDQRHKSTTFLNATVNASLSPDIVSLLIQRFEFDVHLGAKLEPVQDYPLDDSVMEVACNGMRVEFSSNATQGVMVGGRNIVISRFKQLRLLSS